MTLENLSPLPSGHKTQKYQHNIKTTSLLRFVVMTTLLWRHVSVGNFLRNVRIHWFCSGGVHLGPHTIFFYDRTYHQSYLYLLTSLLQAKSLDHPHGTCGVSSDFGFTEANYTKNRCNLECETSLMVNKCGCREYYMESTGRFIPYHTYIQRP